MIQRLQQVMVYGDDTKDIEALYDEMKAKDITLGEITDMGGQKTFNFADREGNYFAATDGN